MGHESECDLHATDEGARSGILPTDVAVIVSLGVISDEVLGKEGVEVVYGGIEAYAVHERLLGQVGRQGVTQSQVANAQEVAAVDKARRAIGRLIRIVEYVLRILGVFVLRRPGVFHDAFKRQAVPHTPSGKRSTRVEHFATQAIVERE